MPQTRLILDHVLGHAEQHPDRVYLTQPLGGGRAAPAFGGGFDLAAPVWPVTGCRNPRAPRPGIPP